MDKLKFTLRDLIYVVLLGVGFAVQWGTYTANANATTRDVAELKGKVSELTEIKSDLKVLKEAALDSRQRIIRIEDKLLKASQ